MFHFLNFSLGTLWQRAGRACGGAKRRGTRQAVNVSTGGICAHSEKRANLHSSSRRRLCQSCRIRVLAVVVVFGGGLGYRRAFARRLGRIVHKSRSGQGNGDGRARARHEHSGRIALFWLGDCRQAKSESNWRKSVVAEQGGSVRRSRRTRRTRRRRQIKCK
jgi:hypothetical protein